MLVFDIVSREILRTIVAYFALIFELEKLRLVERRTGVRTAVRVLRKREQVLLQLVVLLLRTVIAAHKAMSINLNNCII